MKKLLVSEEHLAPYLLILRLAHKHLGKRPEVFVNCPHILKRDLLTHAKPSDKPWVMTTPSPWFTHRGATRMPIVKALQKGTLLLPLQDKEFCRLVRHEYNLTHPRNQHRAIYEASLLLDTIDSFERSVERAVGRMNAGVSEELVRATLVYIHYYLTDESERHPHQLHSQPRKHKMRVQYHEDEYEKIRLSLNLQLKAVLGMPEDTPYRYIQKNARETISKTLSEHSDNTKKRIEYDSLSQQYLNGITKKNIYKTKRLAISRDYIVDPSWDGISELWGSWFGDEVKALFEARKRSVEQTTDKLPVFQCEHKDKALSLEPARTVSKKYAKKYKEIPPDDVLYELLLKQMRGEVKRRMVRGDRLFLWVDEADRANRVGRAYVRVDPDCWNHTTETDRYLKGSMATVFVGDMTGLKTKLIRVMIQKGTKNEFTEAWWAGPGPWKLRGAGWKMKLRRERFKHAQI